MQRQIALALLLSTAGICSAQVYSPQYSAPALDRWMYPFNATPGTETLAPSFGAIQIVGFDDRDSQVLLGWNTGAEIPAGLAADQYHFVSAELTVGVANHLVARYDPTWDSYKTLLDTADPSYIPDADAGKPVELFGAGFRNGWTPETFLETSRFGGAPLAPPAEGARNVFAAVFTESGTATDVSRQIRLRFEAQPFAIGQTDAVTPGELMAAGTVLTFRVGACDADARSYFESAAASGRLRLIVSSLEPAQGGPGGGSGDPTYPVFATKEGGTGLQATLHLTVRVGPVADFNGDGFVDFFDFTDFVDAFESGAAQADFNHDCFVDFFDFSDFVTAFEG